MPDFLPGQRVRVRQRPDLSPGTVTRTHHYRNGVMVYVVHDDLDREASWWARDLAPVVPSVTDELLYREK